MLILAMYSTFPTPFILSNFLVLQPLVDTVQMQMDMGLVPDAWPPMATPTMDF